MKSLFAALLATAAGSSFAFAPTAALNHDPDAYRAMTQKAAAEYKAALAKCGGMSGNDKDVCTAEAKAERTRAESEALAKYSHTEESKARAAARVADADFAVAKAKCGAMSGADKDSCLNNAKSVHTAALADAKARGSAAGASDSGQTGSGGDATSATDKCAQAGGDARTGCLVQTKPSPVANAAANASERTRAAAADTADKSHEAEDRARVATANATEKTKVAASTVAEKTKELAQATVEKTREVAHTVAQKTESAMDRAGEKSREVASTAAQKTESTMDSVGNKTRRAASTAAHKTENAMDRAGEKTRDIASTAAGKADRTKDGAERDSRVAANDAGRIAADSAITTKVKAELFVEPNLKSMGIHVKTEDGVVMLSGFVDSKSDAERAVEVAKGVDGVANVKSAIKVK